MSERPIHIALTFDDNYWAPAYATMRSICLSTKRRTDLVFHLCHRSLSTAHRQDLEKIGSEFGASLRYYDIDQLSLFTDVAARAPLNQRLSNIVYARLLFDRFLPQDIARLTYLDCDMMVRAPIEEVAECALEGQAIAAVDEPHKWLITHYRDMEGNRDLFDPADSYFNAGLLVIDMAAWRAAHVMERLEAAMADGTMSRIYYDQDLLNLIFKDNWRRLDQMWNVVDPRLPIQALNPKLVHYTGNRKPWNLVSLTAYARIYRHVMTNELYYRYARHRMVQRVRKWLRLK